MSAITQEAVRAVVEQLADPAFAGLFEDLLAQRSIEMDEGLDPAERRAAGGKAAALLGELVGAVAAELGARDALIVDIRHVQRPPAVCLLITLSGDLGETSAPQVREAIKKARTPDGYQPIAIDLSKATVHGREGLSPLVGAFFAAKRGAEFYLVAPPPMVSRVLGGINGAPVPTFATVDELEQALTAEGAAL